MRTNNLEKPIVVQGYHNVYAKPVQVKVGYFVVFEGETPETGLSQYYEPGYTSLHRTKEDAEAELAGKPGKVFELIVKEVA